MSDVIDTIIIALKADTAVKSSVNDRIYWLKPPGENYTYPFLTVIEASNTEGESADDEEYESNIILSVEIFSRTPFRPLQNAVQTAMRKQGYTREAGPDEWIHELKCYHKAINFRKE